MRQTVVCLLALLIGTAALAQGVDGKSDFRGVRFGEDISARDDMVYVKDDGGTKIYTRRNDKMSLGSVPLESLVYVAWHGRLLAVMMASKDMSGLKATLIAAFGEPDSNRRGEPFWAGRTLVVNYSDNRFSGIARCAIFGAEMFARYEEERQTEAEHGASDF